MNLIIALGALFLSFHAQALDGKYLKGVPEIPTVGMTDLKVSFPDGREVMYRKPWYKHYFLIRTTHAITVTGFREQITAVDGFVETRVHTFTPQQVIAEFTSPILYVGGLHLVSRSNRVYNVEVTAEGWYGTINHKGQPLNDDFKTVFRTQ